MLYLIKFWNKKGDKVVHTELVESESTFGIFLKAKQQALSLGFKYDKR